MSGFQDIDIQPLIKQFNIENFVETGCFTGDGINHALMHGIRNVYSCDIIDVYVNHCKNRFPGISVLHKPSIDFLNEVVDFIPGPCLFWLDAHFPDLYGQMPKTELERFPLIEEVKILAKKEGIEKDVIIIDDIRVLISDDNPIRQEFDKKYEVHGFSVKTITDLFPNHDSKLLNWQEGVLFLTPKEKLPTT